MILDSTDNNNTRFWAWFSEAAHQTHAGAALGPVSYHRIRFGILNGTETFTAV